MALVVSHGVVMSTPFRDPGVSVYDFGLDFLVRCPACRRRATVLVRDNQARFTCLHCGRSESRPSSTHVVQNQALDWYFGFPLWLQVPCAGECLWARNVQHLDFLEAFLGAGIRQRPPEPTLYRNRLLASRLPGWMKLRSNRRAVQVALARLRALTSNP